MACLPQPATGTCFLAAGQASVQLRLADQPFGPVRKLLVLMGLDRKLPIFPSIGQALAAPEAPAPPTPSA